MQRVRTLRRQPDGNHAGSHGLEPAVAQREPLEREGATLATRGMRAERCECVDGAEGCGASTRGA